MSSSNTSSADLIVTKNITVMFVEIWSPLLIFLGTIGHSLNIYVFTCPKLRSNSCARYFLASAISGFILILSTILVSLIQIAYDIDVFGYSTASCKILTFLTFSCRFLCSSQSVAKRAWSHPRMACRIIPLATLVSGLVYIYIPIGFELKQTSPRCPTAPSNNAYIASIVNVIIFGIGPSIIMLIFGSLTIRHVQLSVRRVTNQCIDIQNKTRPSLLLAQLQRQNTIDRQLTKMMIVQVICFIVMSSPSSMFGVYTQLRQHVILDAVQSAENNLIAIVLGFLSFTCACTSFYFFTLSSELFRRELIQLFKDRWRSSGNVITNVIIITSKF